MGRKSGEPPRRCRRRRCQECPAIVVVASRVAMTSIRRGSSICETTPTCKVSLKGQPKQPMRARIATSDERAKLWPRATADHKNYADYQTKTDREIPLVLLEPVS